MHKSSFIAILSSQKIFAGLSDHSMGGDFANAQHFVPATIGLIDDPKCQIAPMTRMKIEGE
jgi:hypothetical protein